MSRYRFDRFLLDQRDRVLARDDAPVELNARYFDALALLVREPGALVSKDRFLTEVWRGVPVTDEALTQCIRTLRRVLGDDAAAPRLIATVPKHGYRFIAPVEREADGGTPDAEDGAGTAVATASSPPPSTSDEVAEGAPTVPGDAMVLAGAGTVGGAIAGLIGGLIYGFAAAPITASGTGAASTLLVLTAITVLVALVGGAGVAGGIAIAGRVAGGDWRLATLGGAAGGLVVGAVVKMLGVDAFTLMLGRSPADFTGAMEGLVVGGAVGLAGTIAARTGGEDRIGRVRRGALIAAAIGAAAGVAVILAGGRLLAGSLDQFAQAMPGSRLSLARIGALFGESGLGPISQAVTGALEGGMFAAGVVATMLLARRSG